MKKITTLMFAIIIAWGMCISVSALETNSSGDGSIKAPVSVETTAEESVVPTQVPTIASEEEPEDSIFPGATLTTIFICVFAYRLFSNISGLLRIKYYDKEYTMYLSHPERDFAEHTAPIVQLFKEAGMKDRHIPYVQPMGYGQLLQGHTSLFSNIANRREDVVANMLSCFAEAKGIYKHRIFETFSPLFWVKQLLFLPRAILAYLGVAPESVVVKIFQLLYWLATPVLLTFRDAIYQYVISLLS